MSRHLSLKELVASGATIPALSYGRVSSERQLSGQGLRRQRDGNYAWIGKHPELHIRIDGVMEDRARSAWKGDHVLKDDAALGKIVEMVKSGELRPPFMLIVEALDRLSRENPWLAQERLAGLVNRGVLVATTKDDKIYHRNSDMADLILSIVYMAGAHAESESKSQRVHETKLIHVQNAMTTKQVIHQNCKGWLRVPDKISPTNRLSRKYERIEEHCATVQTIFELGLHHGSAYITAWLIANKVKPFGRTDRWSIRTVKQILRSRAPLGHLESKHGIIEDNYPRVISDELWLQVQAAQDARRDAGRKSAWRSEQVNLLAGLGVCESCGGKLRLVQPGTGKHWYYGCHNRAVLHTCANSSRYRRDIIEDALLHKFGLGWLETQPGKVTVNIPALQAELTKLREREQRLAKKLQELDNDQMFDTIMTQLRELRGLVNDAATKLNAAQQQAAVAKASVKISDLTDRAAVATALKRQLIAVRFGAGNRVELEGRSHVLTVVARQDGERPTLAIKCDREPGGAPIWRSTKRHSVA